VLEDIDVCEELCEHPLAVQLAKAEGLSDDDARHLAETFRLLGDATRVKILQILSRRELCVCDLAAATEMGQSAISHQLRLLRGARLVKYRKKGKMAWYSLDDGYVNMLLTQGIEHIKHR